MADKRVGLQNLAILLICVSALFSTVQGQRVDVQPRNATVLEGGKAQILCRFGKPLQYCRIVIPGETRVLNLSPQWDKTPGFQYFGEGLEQGQCGVTIMNVKNANHGTVKCNLGADGEDFEGISGLTVALAPLRPEMEINPKPRSGSFEIGEQIHATCISRDGRPAANITFYLDDEPITDGLGIEEIIESMTSHNTMLYTAKRTLTKYIQATDDRKKLICRTSHIAEHQQQEASQQLQVRFRPQPLPVIKVYGVILGSDAIINATINSNPRPRTEWVIDGVSIPQGTQNGRYESYEPIDLGNGVFNVSLTIASLTLEDTTKEYYLKASNEFGTQDYTIRISSSEAAISNGLDMAAIIGIVVAVAIIVLIVALVIVARATGKWCFADKASGTSGKPHGSETSDTESADLKQTKSKKYQINFEGLFKRKPQKPTDVEKNAQAEGSAEDPNDDAAPSEATVIIEDDPPKAGEKNLVYAELMLKPSDDGTNPNKNATEYAEIVYVNPPAEKK